MINQTSNYTTIPNCFAEIDGKRFPIKRGIYGDFFVVYQYRTRIIQRDELGATFLETKYSTVRFQVIGEMN